MRRRAEWTKRVERWKRSGLEAADFARREGLKPRQFYWWCWRLGACPQPPTGPRRLPVRVEEPSPPPAPAWIEVALPNRGLLYLLPGVDPATLACVLVVAAELSARGIVEARPAPAAQVELRNKRR